MSAHPPAASLPLPAFARRHHSAASTTAPVNGQTPLTAFDFAPRTRVVFGPGTLAQIGELTAAYGRRVFLVTDSGLRSAGHPQRVSERLREAGLEVIVFDEVHPNPTTEDVERGLHVAREAQIDVIIGLGGGSSLDCAKGVNFLLTNGGRMEDYWGVGKASKPMLPMIAVPTTAGTGSEAQSFAVISQADTHRKMACGDKKAACVVAVLDPELSVSMPPAVTAVTGIDALSHALETYVTKPRNPLSQLFSRQAWQLLATGFPRVLDDPADLDARGAMLLGANFAGTAIENSMLGATHALANPLSARFDLTHGVAIGVLLPHVIRYNAEVVGSLYADLAGDIGLADRSAPDAPAKLADFVTGLVARAGQPSSLDECDVPEEALPQLAQDAATQWTGQFNPRPVDTDSLQELYRCALKPLQRASR